MFDSPTLKCLNMKYYELAQYFQVKMFGNETEWTDRQTNKQTNIRASGILLAHL